MAKFVIECPNGCGNYLEVNTGLDGIKAFFKGEKTNVCSSCSYKYKGSNQLNAKKCNSCGNNVVYDQSKGENALCPVCKSKVNTLDSLAKSQHFTCPQCGCGLSTDLKQGSFTCPICDHIIANVAKEIELAKIAKSGLASVIKYEGGNDTFVWKHPVEDFNIGSQLIVHESQEAIFFRNGKALDLFTAGRYALETESIPLINQLYNSVLDPKDVFHSEVYFINMTTQMALKWGTDSKVRFLEPSTGIPFDLGASGEFNLCVSDSRKLIIKLVGTEGGLDRSALLFTNSRFEDESSHKSVSGYFRSMIMTRVKTHLAKTIKESQINILEIDEHLETLSSALRLRINEGLEEYGLTMSEFFVTTIVTPDDDVNFKKLKQQHADLYLRTQDEKNLKTIRESEAERRMVEERTKAQMKIIEAQGGAEVTKISAQAEAEAYRMQAGAEADEMKMKGYTYVQETQRQVGLETVKGGVVKEGSSGVGGGSGIGDVVGLGVALGALGGVMDMAKEAITPIINTSTDVGKATSNFANPQTIGWNCTCGVTGITGNFCSGCGAKRPEIPQPWNCPKCNVINNKGNFCSICGEKKVDGYPWDCSCGEKSIKGNFCSNCGKKRGE